MRVWLQGEVHHMCYSVQFLVHQCLRRCRGFNVLGFLCGYLFGLGLSVSLLIKQRLVVFCVHGALVLPCCRVTAQHRHDRVRWCMGVSFCPCSTTWIRTSGPGGVFEDTYMCSKGKLGTSFGVGYFVTGRVFRAIRKRAVVYAGMCVRLWGGALLRLHLATAAQSAPQSPHAKLGHPMYRICA